MTPKEIAKTAANAAIDKKALDLVVLQVTRLTTLADYFIICGGNSNIQLRSITDAVEKNLAEISVHPKHIEGYRTASWILMDYGSVIVHVLKKDMRSFYDLERLWGDAEVVPLESFLESSKDAPTLNEHENI